MNWIILSTTSIYPLVDVHHTVAKLNKRLCWNKCTILLAAAFCNKLSPNVLISAELIKLRHFKMEYASTIVRTPIFYQKSSRIFHDFSDLSCAYPKFPAVFEMFKNYAWLKKSIQFASVCEILDQYTDNKFNTDCLDIRHNLFSQDVGPQNLHLILQSC